MSRRWDSAPKGWLDGEFSGKLDFRCVGPLPPYSFATVQVQRRSFESLDEARRQLGLKETANPEEIKRAYRQLSRRVHPDVNRGDPQAEQRVAQLTRAYELLTAYA